MHNYFFMGIFSFLTGNRLKRALQQGAVVIDVRTASEFDRGRVPGSLNIPVDRIAMNADRIKHMNKPVILCCSSGHRSKEAAQMLKKSGIIMVINAGSWEKVLKAAESL